MFRIPFVFAFAACAIAQPPLVYNRAVLNGASFMPPGIPGGAVAQGSLFSIFGTNIGPAQGLRATSYPLDTTLGGVSITVSQGTNTVNVIPYYVSAGQINAIMPSSAPVGTVSLRVTTGGGKSNAVPVLVTSSAFGIFSANSGGSGPGILQNFVAVDSQPVNAPNVAAKPGQTIILWGTGLGPIAGGDNVAPPVGNLAGVKAEVFVGGQAAVVAYSGRAPGFAGTDQINFIVPQNAPSGCWVPVYVRTNGTNVSNFVTMAIQPDGGTCSDPMNPLAKALVAGDKTGAVAIIRETTHEDVGVTSATDVATDFTIGGFSSFARTPFAFHPALSLPPAGSCTEYIGKADLMNGSFVGFATPPAGAALNAGSPSVLTGPASAVHYSPFFGSYQGALIGSSAAGVTSGALTLTPGTYSLTGGGGSDVGSFTASLNVPQPITWTNRNQITTVSRSQPLTISWSGAGTNDVIGVVGIGTDLPSNSAAAFACLAQPGASSLTVPADVLFNLPPTQQTVLNSADVLYLVSVPQSAIAALNATGLDTGVALFAYVNGKTVIFQ